MGGIVYDQKILVIEDEFYISDILSTSLKSETYLVRCAFNAKEARELLNSFNPDLALLDVNLPDESGFDLCKFINTTYTILTLLSYDIPPYSNLEFNTITVSYDEFSAYIDRTNATIDNNDSAYAYRPLLFWIESKNNIVYDISRQYTPYFHK